MFSDHLNTTVDDYPTTIGVALLKPDDEDEAASQSVPAPKRETHEQATDKPEDEHIPFGNVEGSVRCNKQYGIWYYTWSENGKRRSKSLGKFPDRDSAWRAAEPLREAAKQRRRQLHHAAVEQTLQTDERSNAYLFRTGKYVLEAYVAQRLSSDTRGGLRAFRYDAHAGRTGCNQHFLAASKSDFLADSETTLQRTLSLHQRALIQLLYFDFPCKTTEAEIEKCFPGELERLYTRLGAAFKRRGMANLKDYFRPFPHPRDVKKPKQLR